MINFFVMDKLVLPTGSTEKYGKILELQRELAP
jgi:hypothetical protein